MTDRRKDPLLALVIAGVGFLATWQAGRIGFYALDQSIVFDGAWRVLCGQVPWRDFVLPAGLTPVLMQAAVFAVFGVSWTSYVLHAALVNAVASGIVYIFLRHCSLGRALSAGCAVVTAATLYPPNGTPYLEIHAFFFSLVALWLAEDAARTPLPLVRWIGIAACAALAALSKQIPTAFVIPVIVILVAANQDRVGRTDNLRRAAAACGIIVAVGIALFVAARADSGLFWTHYLRLPLGIGSDRQGAAGYRLLLAVESSVVALPFTSRLLAVAVLVFMTGAVGGLLRALRRGQHVPPFPPGGVLLIIALWLILSSWLFVAMTNNAPEQGFGFTGVAAGLAMAGLRLAGGSIGWDVLSWASRWGADSRMRSVVVVLVAAGLMADAMYFHHAVNLPRTVHEMHVDSASWDTWAADAHTPPMMKAVGFSLWTAQSKYTAAETSLSALIEYLRGPHGNFVILGDETVIYGLTGKPSPTPFLWFHPGLVWADTSVSHAQMNGWLERSLSRYDVRMVVLPANFGAFHWNIETFDALASRMPSRSACRSLGDYLLCSLRAP